MKYIFTQKYWKHWLSVPFIWMVLAPVITLHIFVEIYHQVCFRLYDVERVRASAYFNFDRQKLSYLSFLDKLNCGYCSYVNGVFAYVGEIGRRTEYYWCGIKHANHPDNPIFAYQDKFANYGDEAAYESIREHRCKR